jgi:RTA1 like protein
MCDVVAFLIQVLGGVMATSTTISTVNTGFRVLQIGLAVQIAAFGFFLLISFRFHIISRTFRSSWPDTRWVTLLWAINGASTLIFVRSIYRLAEFSTGFGGYLNTHEWAFFLFDGAIILIAMATFNIWHPARYLNNVGWKQTDGGWAERENGVDLDAPVGSNTIS